MKATLTQEEAFLQAICEAPSDDVPRLVYADWLEENGGPDGADRAEFIRVQIERARLPGDDPRQAALRKREERLAEGHAYGWRVQLPRLPGVTWRRFWRGFLAGAAAERWRDYRRHAKALFAATPVQFLSLGGVNAERCRRLARSRYLGRLLGLTLRGSVGDAGALALAASPHLGGLTSLDLRGHPIGEEAAAALRERFGSRVTW
jgi:uncharacterized protein (TIGR02996 family)